MSNFLALATATETIRFVLNHYVGVDVNGATASAVSPSGVNNTGTGNGLPTTGVNVFLYQIMPNAAGRNLDLPTRRSDGSLVQRPRAAVDAHFIFSVYGSYAAREPQRVMGSVIRTLNSFPYLTRQFIEQAVAQQGTSDLQGQDLSTDVELVKLMPLALTLDELSRVWSVYFQTSYALSVCYMASVIFLEDTGVSNSSNLPVQTSNILATPIDPPSIDSVTPQPATASAVITINGPNVGVGAPFVRIGTNDPVSPTTIVNADQITVDLSTTVLSPTGLLAGILPLSVLQKVDFGTPGASLLRSGVESSPLAFLLAPTLTLPSNTATINNPFTVNFDTPVGPQQNVSLILGSFAIQIPGRSVVTDPTPVKTFTVKIPTDAPIGTVPVRLQVDGVQSALTFDSGTGQFTPSVTIS
jgi:hypothetical protein